MLHIKFHGYRSIGCGGEDFLKGFIIYGHGKDLGHMIRLINKNFHFNSHISFHMKFGFK